MQYRATDSHQESLPHDSARHGGSDVVDVCFIRLSRREHCWNERIFEWRSMAPRYQARIASASASVVDDDKCLVFSLLTLAAQRPSFTFLMRKPLTRSRNRNNTVKIPLMISRLRGHFRDSSATESVTKEEAAAARRATSFSTRQRLFLPLDELSFPLET